MQNKIVIIGLGNIGRRHLQSVARIEGVASIICFDVKKEALDYLSTFCQQNDIAEEKIVKLSDKKDLYNQIDANTCVIIATTASGRLSLFEKVMAKKPRAILAEKPLCQTDAEYKQIQKLANGHGVPVYVNFCRHAYAFYQEIYAAIKNDTQRTLLASFSGGLSCSGIHLLELWTWLFNVKEAEVLLTKMGEVFDSKRKGFVDFSGDLILRSGQGDLAVLRAFEEEGNFSLCVTTKQNEFKVYEDHGKMLITDQSGKFIEKRIEVVHVSQLSSKVMADFISKGATEILPDIEQTYLAHRILFDFMERNDTVGLKIT